MKLYDFEFEGKKYKQKKLREAAEIVGISYNALFNRMKRNNYNIQDAIDPKPKFKLYDFKFNGKKYYKKTLNEVAEITGISYTTLLARLKKMRIQDAINKPIKTRNSSSKLYDFEFEGKKYEQKTVKEVADITGIRYDTLSYRLSKIPIQEAINKHIQNRNSSLKLYDFEFEGKKYEQKNLYQISKITGINYITLLVRMRKMSIQDAINKPVKNNASKLYDFEFEGKKYKQKTVKEVADITGISYATLLARLRKIPIQEVINKHIQNRNYSSKLYDFEFESKKYSQKNLKEVAEIIGISYQTLFSRLKKMTIQEAINKDIQKRNSSKLYDFEFEGKKYLQKNLHETANITGINYVTLSYRLENMPIQDAINKPIKNQNSSSKLYDFEFEGKKYEQKNLYQISKITGIRYDTLSYRLKKMSIQESIDMDFIISEDGQYYNFEQVSEEFNLEVKQVKKLKKLGFTYEDFKNI